MADTEPAPGAWRPDSAAIKNANLTAFMQRHGFDDYRQLHRWSVENRAAFWDTAIEELGIVFDRPPDDTLDTSAGIAEARWLPGAMLNAVASCFGSPPERAAIVTRRDEARHEISYADLRSNVNRVANGLVAMGVAPGDRVAIAMPMTPESVYAYLGIVAAGGVVVSIADSFAPDEIAARLAITGARIVVTQDNISRAGKVLPMFDKVAVAGPSSSIVVRTGDDIQLGGGDVWWDDFLGPVDHFQPIPAQADAHTNILFSSGTTGEPKAIPWTHLTPIKAAVDGYFHQDIHSGDVIAWHTNLGWMMGPWLIYASLINQATFALFDDIPTGPEFCRFVEEAGVTVLGVVPSLVSAWRSSGATDDRDWSKIRLFSSTGEASNANDMSWLMGVAGNKPVIEYCGGTEIGGGYMTGTVVQPAIPGMFSTPTLGLDVEILDDEGRSISSGEVYLVPPSIGLSTELLNGDHDAVYYADTPRPGLRRHGDHMEQTADGYYRAHGRIDDTMNLAGIKVSSAEIERAVATVLGVEDAAAVAVTPEGGGPAQLVVFVVTPLDRPRLQADIQQAISQTLNPLFKVFDVVRIDALPRTASAKIMRRRLRAEYTMARS